jgi:hypothetical protein
MPSSVAPEPLDGPKNTPRAVAGRSRVSESGQRDQPLDS